MGPCPVFISNHRQEPSLSTDIFIKRIFSDKSYSHFWHHIAAFL